MTRNDEIEILVVKRPEDHSKQRCIKDNQLVFSGNDL